MGIFHTLFDGLENVPPLQIVNWVGGIGSFIVALTAFLLARERFRQFVAKWKSLIASLLVCWALVACYSAGWFTGVLRWFARPTGLPMWAMLLLILGLVSALAFIGLIFYWRFGAAKQNPTEDLNNRHYSTHYLNDRIFELNWNWFYDAGGSISPGSLIAFCPRQTCRHRIEYTDDFSPNWQATLSMKCARCGYLKHFDFAFDDLRHRAVMEIERRINTGDWRTAPQRMQDPC